MRKQAAREDGSQEDEYLALVNDDTEDIWFLVFGSCKFVCRNVQLILVTVRVYIYLEKEEIELPFLIGVKFMKV